MSAPQTPSLNLLGLSEHSTMQARPSTGVRNADVTMTNADAARMKPSNKRGPLLEMRPAR